VATALERVRQEAGELGAKVLETEIVGLVPQEAACDVIREALASPAFGADRLLEARICTPLS
jgi:glutamate formiminotransferase